MTEDCNIFLCVYFMWNWFMWISLVLRVLACNCNWHRREVDLMISPYPWQARSPRRHHSWSTPSTLHHLGRSQRSWVRSFAASSWERPRVLSWCLPSSSSTGWTGTLAAWWRTTITSGRKCFAVPSTWPRWLWGNDTILVVVVRKVGSRRDVWVKEMQTFKVHAL